MEWIQFHESSHRCKKWVPKSQWERMNGGKAAAKQSVEAALAMREAKRQRKTGEELRARKTALTKARKQYDALRNDAIAKGVYILQAHGGFCIFRNSTGSQVHSLHPTLEEAQAAAEAML